MHFCLLILGAPGSSTTRSAYRFAQATLSQGHQISRLFFYHDGVHNASALTSPPRDEEHPSSDWAHLIREHQIAATVCVASGVRKGMVDDTQAQRFGHPQGNTRPEFEVAGLSDLVGAAADADRVITFGP